MLNVSIKNNLTVFVCETKQSKKTNKSITMSSSGSNVPVSTQVFYIIGSIGSSVLIILTNKLLMKNFRFPFVLLLTAIHFLFTYICVWTSMSIFGNDKSIPDNSGDKATTSQQDIEAQQQAQQQPPQQQQDVGAMVPMRDRVISAALNSTTVFLFNSSLKYNSIGLFQLSKLASIPFYVFVQYVLFGVKYELPIYGSLTVLLLGVSLSTVTDFELNAFGGAIAIASIVANTAAQIAMANTQQKYKLNGETLMYVIMLPQAIISLIGAFLLEVIHSADAANIIFYFTGTSGIIVLVTALLAYATNLFAFNVLGMCTVVFIICFI